MNKLTGKFDFWDSKTKTLVMPLHADFEKLDHTIWQIQQLGINLLGEIDMPISLGLRFLVGTIPEQFSIDRDDEFPEFYSLQDKKGRQRLRVITKYPMATTTVFTRYYIDRDYTKFPSSARVIDIQESQYDENFEDEKVIWRGEVPEDSSDFRQIASVWLDKNYPDWQDPTAYWS